MLKWIRERHCGQCFSKGLQITKLQQALHTMAEDANELDKTIQNLRYKLRTREVNTGDRDFLEKNELMRTIRELKEIIKGLREENARLNRKVQFITEEPLPAEFTQDIELRNLNTRIVNFLKNEKILSYMDLLDKSEAEILRTPNFGRSSLNILKAHLREKFHEHQANFNCLDPWSY